MEVVIGTSVTNTKDGETEAGRRRGLVCSSRFSLFYPSLSYASALSGVLPRLCAVRDLRSCMSSSLQPSTRTPPCPSSAVPLPKRVCSLSFPASKLMVTPDPSHPES